MPKICTTRLPAADFTIFCAGNPKLVISDAISLGVNVGKCSTVALLVNGFTVI